MVAPSNSATCLLYLTIVFFSLSAEILSSVFEKEVGVLN